MKQVVDAAGLVAEELVDLGLAQAAHDLGAVGEDGVVPAHAEGIAVLDPGAGGEEEGRAGVLEPENARVGLLAELRVADGLEVLPLLEEELPVGGGDCERTALAP